VNDWFNVEFRLMVFSQSGAIKTKDTVFFEEREIKMQYFNRTETFS
jgi:hypothetical protein